MRYLCIDFETNGFRVTRAAPQYRSLPLWVMSAAPQYQSLPFCSYPVQVCVHAVEDGAVSHLYGTVICGATSMSEWCQCNIRLTLEEIAAGIPFQQMITEVDDLVQPGDILVAHKAEFDIGTCIGTTAQRLGYDSPDLQKILTAPRFCTMLCAYSRQTFNGRWPKMVHLCEHFQVELIGAHDAAADSLALAKCVAEALRRGVMF